MNSNTRRFITLVGIAVGLMTPLNMASADSASFEQLSAQWQQWVLSIPRDTNPQRDTTGAHCVVGQRGSVWFLAGTFGGGSATRTCAVPEGKELFFPVINSVNIDAPNVCGQGDSIPVEDWRALSAAFIDGATKLSVKVDGKQVKSLVQRIQSEVFEVALPEDNVFDDPCASLGGVPAGIYSPAVDDGFYRINVLKINNLCMA
jgi:hypothetical protein